MTPARLSELKRDDNSKENAKKTELLMRKFKQEFPAPRACQSVIQILAHFFEVVKKKQKNIWLFFRDYLP